MFFFSLIVSFITGYLFCFLLWPDRKSIFSDIIIKASLGVGVGFGFSSIVCFIWLLLRTPQGSGFIKVDFIVHFCFCILILCGLKLKNIKNRKDFSLQISSIKNASGVSRKIFIITCIAGIITFIFASLLKPHGEGDAYAIWNIRAKVLYTAPEPWLETFRQGAVGHHSDYPLLIPGIIARSWKYMGVDGILAPISLHMILTFATVFLMFSAVSIIRNEKTGIIAGLIIAGTPFFIREGIAQQADLAVSYFILSTMVLFALYDTRFRNYRRLLCLAGMMAGFTAWTKNEGLLFLVCIISVRFGVVTFRRNCKTGLQELLYIFSGLAPILMVILYFKYMIAPQNDLIAGQGIDATLMRLMDYNRYWLTGKAYFTQMLSFSRWQLYPVVLILYVIFSGIDSDRRKKISIESCVVVVTLMLIGYFFVYITTPADITWHLRTSLIRLLLHLFPITLLTVFLSIRVRTE